MNPSNLTDEQKIAYLAEKVMGWKYHKDFAVEIPPMRGIRPWNPLTDWNHWRQVEEKIMYPKEDREWRLLERFFETFDTKHGKGIPHLVMKADLPTRVDALIQAHSSLQDA